MKYESTKKNIGLVSLFLFLIFIDQLSKYLVRYFDGFYICNSGISFGIQLPEFLFWIFWIGIIFFLIYLITKKQLLTVHCSLFLVLAGAISNIIDRLYFGCIIDFIDLKIWPVFNLADIFITTGAILIAIKLLQKEKL